MAVSLQIVPARTGVTWVRIGIRTFWRQPLALTGLFFLLMAAVSITAFVPVIGGLFALMLLPAGTAGMMQATRVVEAGRFPLPLTLAVVREAPVPQRIAMAQLGLLYALGFVSLMALSAIADGGQLARVYLLGDSISTDALRSPETQNAVLVAMALYLPLSMMFWFAPALVQWHGQSAVKSLFFSSVACLRNWRAFLLYSTVWSGVFVLAMLVLMMVTAMFNAPNIVAMGMMPLSMLMAAMFFTSIEFSFRDCFVEVLATPPEA